MAEESTMAEEREYGLDEMPENMDTEEGGADLLQIYLDEVNAVPELSEEEEEQLVKAARMGDFDARDRLMEGYLKHAMTLIREFMGGPLQVTEMIGISNLALVKAVRLFLGSLQTEALRDMITRTVKEDLSAAAERERSQSDAHSASAAKAHRLTDVSRVLAQELGRPATEAELAERMRITEDEVRTLIEMTMRAI